MARGPAYKTDEWLQAETQFRNLDNGGKIDDGILDLVVALNLIGIPTIGSCGGHFKPELEPNILGYMKENGIPIPNNQGMTHYPYVEIAIDDALRLQALLEAFYARDVLANNYELGTVMAGKGNIAILRNMNAPGYVFPIQDPWLADYQQEFAAFTSWLKRRWRRLRKGLQE